MTTTEPTAAPRPARPTDAVLARFLSDVSQETDRIGSLAYQAGEYADALEQSAAPALSFEERVERAVQALGPAWQPDGRRAGSITEANYRYIVTVALRAAYPEEGQP